MEGGVKRLLVVGLVVLSGCAEEFTGRTVMLRNAMGQTATCGPYYRDSIGSNSMALRESQCISDFQRQGYQRVSN